MHDTVIVTDESNHFIENEMEMISVSHFGTNDGAPVTARLIRAKAD